MKSKKHTKIKCNNMIYYIYVEINGNISITSFFCKTLAYTNFARYNKLLEIYPTMDIECGDKILFLREKINCPIEINNLKPEQIIFSITT